MATAKMGAIVTELAGSIGGTTFRRQGNSVIVYPRFNATNDQKLRNNPALARLTSYSNDWQNLTSADRQGWNDQAPSFTYTDKFGSLVPYTGRQLFFAVNSNIEGTGISLPNPANVSSVVPTPTITDVYFFEQTNMFIEFDQVYTKSELVISIEVRQGVSLKPSSKRFKKIAVRTFGNDNTINIGGVVQNEFGLPLQGRSLIVYAKLINDTGYSSPRVSFSRLI
mgnify:CR=1 FL=1